MRYLYFSLAIVLTLLVGRINFKLYSIAADNAVLKKEIIWQLNFLEEELKSNDLAVRMQREFPEGFVFVNVLYGLAWCELVLTAEDLEVSSKAFQEAEYAYQQINSEKGKEAFQPELQPEYGIFYTGWRNYLLAKLLSIQKEKNYSEALVTEFESQCDYIAHAINMSKSPFLQSYSGGAWPADMFLAVASLRIHDQLFQPRYDSIISQWIEKVKLKLDPKFGMIPHRVEVFTGKTEEGPRGGSMALMLRLLPEIDSAFAQVQYGLFKKNYVSTLLGLPIVREYPKGEYGIGDIDSGPVILGVGPAATIVSIGTLKVYGERKLSEKIYLTVNALGLDTKTENKKKYLMGALPIADAFIAWSSASDLYVQQNGQIVETNWRLKFQIASIIFISLIWFLLYKTRLQKLIG